MAATSFTLSNFRTRVEYNASLLLPEADRMKAEQPHHPRAADGNLGGGDRGESGVCVCVCVSVAVSALFVLAF